MIVRERTSWPYQMVRRWEANGDYTVFGTSWDGDFGAASHAFLCAGSGGRPSRSQSRKSDMLRDLSSWMAAGLGGGAAGRRTTIARSSAAERALATPARPAARRADTASRRTRPRTGRPQAGRQAAWLHASS